MNSGGVFYLFDAPTSPKGIIMEITGEFIPDVVYDSFSKTKDIQHVYTHTYDREQHTEQRTKSSLHQKRDVERSETLTLILTCIYKRAV